MRTPVIPDGTVCPAQETRLIPPNIRHGPTIALSRSSRSVGRAISPRRTVARRRDRSRRREMDEMTLRDAAGVVAGRHAVDVGRVRPEVADTGPGERLELIRIGAFLGQDRPLVLGTPERVLADHPVAPHD